ncbi:tetratricopeptide repeat protein [Mucilaginibacter sp. dw_454]|uniref:tetratricopeptide repeat protein n=1 Tax=Mucilaginibacter sp. dw_454 TaxID=2720079 RepID=UPI001BD1F0E8|nr:tetratricopeptide repeat protein [Mucilaginibacter sp. dw_454]
MKFNRIKLTLCFLATFCLPALLFANKQPLFEKANELYSKGQYKEATETYQRILETGQESASVYFNLGNCSYKEGDIPQALLYFEKAHRLAPGDDDINFNIRLATSKTVDKIDEAPEFFVSRWWKGFILNYSADGLATTAIILTLIGSALLIWYFFALAAGAKRFAFFSSIFFFFVAICAIIIACSQANYFDNNKQAIVFTSSVNVKTSPAEAVSTTFVLHDGTKVNIMGNNNGWIRIKIANGNEGWIKEGDVKEI